MHCTALILLPLALLAAAPLAAAEVIPASQFRTFELRGGGEVVVRPGPAQRVTLLEGSSALTTFRMEERDRLVIRACNNRCPRNYKLRIEIQSPNAPGAAIRGGGAITFAPGFPAQQRLAAAIHGGGAISFAPGFSAQRELSAAIHGGGQIDARALSTGTVSAAISGGGRILAGPSRRLSAAINGGGEVRYAGDPETSVAISGGGSVRRAY